MFSYMSIKDSGDFQHDFAVITLLIKRQLSTMQLICFAMLRYLMQP